MFVRVLLFVALIYVPAGCCVVRADEAAQAFVLPKTDDGLPGAGPIRRHDWFQALWMKRRTAFAKQTPSQQGAVVFLGDSITQGWGPQFRDQFPGLNAANRGISGDTTRGMLIRLQQDVLSLKPSAVVMLMGTNDLEEGATPEVIAGNVTLIIGELKKHNAQMPIILCRVFPSSASKKRPAEAIRKLNELTDAAVKGDPQITVLDTWTLYANEQGDAKKEMFPDLLHLNESGYTMWARSLTPVLATLGFLETEPDDFQLEPDFRSLFNGSDLSGWGFHPKDGAPEYFASASTPDGRYVALNGRLIVTTPSEGRRFQQLWTKEEFPGDFTLKLEFRATPNADSGVFIRKPQLQCRDYPLAGPYKELKQYKPQQWNEMIVVVKNNVAHCTCNGEVLEAAFKLPESGPIGLEGDRGQMEYRRIRIRMD
jgi:lysophospholipase L1-like esterase